MPWLALFKRPKILTIIALVIGGGAYIGWQHIKVANLETIVARHETTIATKDSEIRSLVASVDTQNAAVQEWKAKAQTRLETAHKAQREARAARDESNKLLGKLEDMNAQTCEEGIELIDKALNL